MRRIFMLTLPALAVHLPLGMVFGILFDQLGASWYLAPLMSLLVYGGSVQFMALGVLAVHGSLYELLLLSMTLSLRNLFYGLSLIERFSSFRFIEKLYLGLGLVDTTYSLLVTHPPQSRDKHFSLLVSGLSHFYWVVGTTLGALFAHVMPSMEGVEFVLTAFFAVCAVDLYLKQRQLLPILVGLGSGVVALLLWPSHMLTVGVALASAIFLFTYNRQRQPA